METGASAPVSFCGYQGIILAFEVSTSPREEVTFHRKADEGKPIRYWLLEDRALLRPPPLIHYA
jgi:hypothetical protein